MDGWKVGLLLMLAIGAVGCQGGTRENGALQSGPADGIANALSINLKEGMGYGDARAILISTGWRPVVDPHCQANVVGGAHRELCAQHPDSESCVVCKNIPEVGSCSGDGFCGMRFSKEGHSLVITTYGDTRFWNVLGDDSGMDVRGWNIEN